MVIICKIQYNGEVDDTLLLSLYISIILYYLYKYLIYYLK